MAAPKGNTYYQLVRNWKPGAERKYTPEALWEKAIAYFEWVEANPLKEQKAFSSGLVLDVDKQRAMTIQGFCVYANINPGTFYNYETNEAYFEIIARIRNVIYTQKFEGAAAGLLESNIISRELGLTDKKDVTTNGKDVTPAYASIQVTYDGGEVLELKSDEV